jgi:hypothetical protein
MSQPGTVLEPHSQPRPCGPQALPSIGALGGQGDDPPSPPLPASPGPPPPLSPDVPLPGEPWVVPPQAIATTSNPGAALVEDLMRPS